MHYHHHHKKDDDEGIPFEELPPLAQILLVLVGAALFCGAMYLASLEVHPSKRSHLFDDAPTYTPPPPEPPPLTPPPARPPPEPEKPKELPLEKPR